MVPSRSPGRGTIMLNTADTATLLNDIVTEIHKVVSEIPETVSAPILESYVDYLEMAATASAAGMDSSEDLADFARTHASWTTTCHPRVLAAMTHLNTLITKLA